MIKARVRKWGEERKRKRRKRRERENKEGETNRGGEVILQCGLTCQMVNEGRRGKGE